MAPPQLFVRPDMFPMAELVDPTGDLRGRESVTNALGVFADHHGLCAPVVFRRGREISARAGDVFVRATRTDPAPVLLFVAAAQQQGIATMSVVAEPKLVDGWWVTGWEWLDAERPTTLTDVAVLAAQLERTSVVAGLRDIDQVVRTREYLWFARTNAGDSGWVARVHAELSERLDRCAAVWQAATANRRRVLRHGDLSPSNVVVVDDTPTLVDPDVVGVGFTGWDVTRVATGALFGADNASVRDAWDAYRNHGGSHTPDDVAADSLLFMLRRCAWHLWMYTMQPEDSDDRELVRRTVETQLGQIAEMPTR